MKVDFLNYWHSLGYKELKGLSNMQVGLLAQAYAKRLDKCEKCAHYQGSWEKDLDEGIYCQNGDCKMALSANKP